ncbi:F0F1 ATP synthase subunit B [Sphingomonas sp.]|uniref:F0F1 ATP synthase subunit B family protein n=1 Tax=Sphingomonas sp. TaxID=28214 RepID=UPI00286C67FF|nr:F0F1 ATP synthase subunit B [Sphingomonas sp.]
MLELLLAAVEAHGEATAVHEPTAFGFLTPTSFVALAMIAVFALMIWKKVPAAVGKALDGKIAEIRSQLEEAKTLRAEAEALKAEYQAKAAAADGEAKAMVERAQAESKAIVAKAKTDAEALVERRTQMAEAKIAAEERAAIDEVRAVAAIAATAAASRLIAERSDASSDKALVDEAIAGL